MIAALVSISFRYAEKRCNERVWRIFDKELGGISIRKQRGALFMHLGVIGVAQCGWLPLRSGAQSLEVVGKSNMDEFRQTKSGKKQSNLASCGS